jgi:hypothetical protein
MKCRHPYIKDWHVKGGDVSPLSTVSRYQSVKEARVAGTPFPCGQCLHCRINQARVWTCRLLLEQKAHAHAIFVTLTYNDEKMLEVGGNVIKSDLQKFIKRLRKRVAPQTFRYFAVGEYGDKSWRPHYHLAIFGLPKDRRTKIIIQRAWATKDRVFGYVYIGDLNAYSARYIVGYTTQKLTKRNKIGNLEPEFAIMSKDNGGIGYLQIKKIGEQLKKLPFSEERIIESLKIGGKSYPLGRYLNRKLAEILNVKPKLLEQKLYNYQEEIFEKHINEYDYYESIVDEEKQEALIEKKRFKLFKRKHTI